MDNENTKVIGIFDELREANGGIEISNDLKDKFLEQIDTEKNQEGYYLDAFGERISFNGIRQLKKPYTKLNLNHRQQQEILACHQDYFYFRRNYCKILTKSGIGRPEPREYQKRLENELVEGDDVVAFFPRQSGKCHTKDTYININKGDIYMKLTAETIHHIDKIEKYSKNKKKQDRYFMTVEKMLNNKIFKEIKITKIQEEKITELFEVVNNLSFPYKAEWVYKFIKGGLEDNFILRTIRLLEYNAREDVKPSDNTFEKMEILYGEKYANENYDKRSNKFKKGKENPGYHHNGKLSPLSDNFLYEKTDNEKTEIKKKISKSNRENGNNSTTLIYWLNKGYTQEEAEELRSERQQTFSLAICIEKYDEIEGTIIFNERQNKWQKTLSNKSAEETKRINELKGTGRMNQLFSSNPEVKNIPGKLYYVRFYNEEIEFWKIGITSRTVKERFGTERYIKNKFNLNIDIIFIKDDLTFYETFKEEQRILKENKKNRITVNYNSFISTECFAIDIQDKI